MSRNEFGVTSLLGTLVIYDSSHLICYSRPEAVLDGGHDFILYATDIPYARAVRASLTSSLQLHSSCARCLLDRLPRKVVEIC